MNVNIMVTPAASEFIKKSIEKVNGAGLRLTIKKTGCSGYSYAPTVVEETNSKDITFTTESGVTLLVDPTWAHLLDNITIDYVEDEKSGLKQKRLVFINPHEANRCGCGESFHIE